MAIERILAATDFSPAAARAVQRAARLARDNGAQLRIVHAAPDRGFLARLLDRHDAGESQIMRGAERALAGVCRGVETEYGVRPSSGVVLGRASRALEDAAAGFDADLLVIGARGENESAFREPSLGGTALKILKTTRPLLLVRKPADDDYRKAVVAVGSAKTSQRILAGARPLVGRIQCCLVHAFEAPFVERLRDDVSVAAMEAYVFEQRNEQERALAALAAAAGFDPPPTTVVVRGDAAGALLSELHVLAPDIVVVGKHDWREHRESVTEYGSVALRVAFGAHCDVLQIP
jgi:nucleotide-binding universal stress UspA family protein